MQLALANSGINILINMAGTIHGDGSYTEAQVTLVGKEAFFWKGAFVQAVR